MSDQSNGIHFSDLSVLHPATDRQQSFFKSKKYKSNTHRFQSLGIVDAQRLHKQERRQPPMELVVNNGGIGGGFSVSDLGEIALAAAGIAALI